MELTKSICVMGHPPGQSRAHMQGYYESNHAPLGIRNFPFRRYVRNHLLNEPDIGFDTITEFWAEDIEACAARMNGPIGDIMRADELKFVDQPRIAPAGAIEHVLSDGEKAGPDGSRYAVLLRFAGSPEPVLAWARTVAEQTPGVSIDLVTSWREPAFPADAVLWTPERPSDEPPAGISARVLEVRRVETPADALAHAGEG